MRIYYISMILSLILALCSCGSARKEKEDVAHTVSEIPQTDPGHLMFENDTIAIYRIDSVSYFQNRKNFFHQRDSIPYIEDLDQAKSLLRGRITFGGWNDENRSVDSLLDDGIPMAVRYDNGKIIETTQEEAHILSEVYFVRYYPTEEVVLFEGGHTSDFSIELKNGQMGASMVGNPEYINYSPKERFRLNGYFPGQDCSSYFIQQQRTDGYTYYASIPIHLTEEGFELCTIIDVFWVAEDDFYFRNTFFGGSDDKRLGFFRLVIK